MGEKRNAWCKSRSDADSVYGRYVFDARGNGGGIICPTITGDHQDRITDYTAIVVESNENVHREEVL